MKAAVLREFGQPLRIEELPMPSPEPDEVLIGVEACGVCHSDLHIIDGDQPGFKATVMLIPVTRLGTRGQEALSDHRRR
jgi:D-arabinose 1-dehydrogenase-like Zn-dependent alcohol dehydrogenase